MKRLLFTLMLVFGIAGFIGAGYVIWTGGEANPGYGVIPMLFCIACSQGYRVLKQKEQKKADI